MSDVPPRLFVPPGSCDDDRLALAGDDARRLHHLGLHAGDEVIVLDDSGWAMTVVLETSTDEACGGPVVHRALAPERRTKVSLFHGLLHPSDFRRLLVAGTQRGVVAIVPVVTDASIVPRIATDGQPEGQGDWPALIRAAAEAAGRGRRPIVRAPVLYDHALDDSVRAGTSLVLDPAGGPLEAALDGRPFSIELFCPPPGGFSGDERARARAHRVPIVRPPVLAPDPIQAALSALDLIYARLEGPASRIGPG